MIFPLFLLSQVSPTPEQAFEAISKRWVDVRSVDGVVVKQFVPKPPAPAARFEFSFRKGGNYRFVSQDVSTFFDGETYYYVDTPNSLYYKILRADPGMEPFVRKPSLRSNYAFYGFFAPPQKPESLAFGTWRGRNALVAKFKGDGSFGSTELTAYYDPKTSLPIAISEGDGTAGINYEYRDLKLDAGTSPSFAWVPPSGYRQSKYEVEALLPLQSSAPVFTVKDPFGKPLALGEVFARNKVTLLEFWFYHCPPCMKAFPKLKALYDAAQDKGLGFVAVNWSDSPELARKFLAKTGYTFPVAMSGTRRGDDIVTAYKVTAFPTTYAIDQDGKVLARWTGIDEPAKFEELITLLRNKGIVVP